LISFLLIFIPAHRSASVDAWLRPRLHRNEAPTWTLWILRAQLVVVYFYAGVAKINADWLRGEPMRMWLARREDLTLLGPLGRLLTEEWVVYLFTYGGLLLDLLIAPLLLWRRSRPYALAAVIVFHLLNAVLFQIGIFPWFMIAATLLFLPPDWPRRICNWPKGADAFPQEVPLRTHRVRPTLAPLAVYLFIQIVVPLRHLLYPGSVHWTEEGHRFSWHMKLRDKKGDADFHLNDPDTGKTWTVNPRRRLSATQVSKMSSRPDMILQFAHFLAMEQRDKGRSRIEVRAEVMVSLNGREPAPLVDPTVDLAAQARTLAHVSWILPLTKPLADTAAKRAAETDREQAGENSTAE